MYAKLLQPGFLFRRLYPLTTLAAHCSIVRSANPLLPNSGALDSIINRHDPSLSPTSCLYSPQSPTCFGPDNNDMRDFLVSRCQYRSCPDDANHLQLRIIKHGHMVSVGFIPNHYAFGSVLRACQELGPDSLKFGIQIHGLICKTRFAYDVLVCNVLISMYGSCCMESLTYARRVFDEIHCRNSVSWNSIISVYSQRGDVVSACELFSDMQFEGMAFSLRPNEYTFCSIITAASSSRDCSSCLLQQMLTRVQKSGFLGDLYVGSALVSSFARVGLIANARKIFGQMGTRSVVTLNGLMVGLVKQKRGEEAVGIFNEMKHLVEVNPDSYVVLLSAFAEFDILEEGIRSGKELHAYVIRSGLDNAKVAVGNGLITMYAKCGAIDYACSVFELMEDKDIVSWNSLISSLDQNELYEESVRNFCRMRRSGLKPSNFTLISCLSSCASLGWSRTGEQVHTEALKLGLDSDVSVSNALLTLYGETGSFTDCEKLFSVIPEHDQVSWNSMIGALADSGNYASEALMYFLRMMRSSWHLSGVTFVHALSAVSSLSLSELSPQLHALAFKYCATIDTTVQNALISCYGKCGRMEDCESIFTRMSARRDEVSWNSMISSYIHNEQLGKAMDLVWFMMQHGHRLDHFIFATVLSACASVATLERGMEVHACEIRAGLEFDVVVGSAIVDMYAKCGRIDYASRFFELMPVRNVYSWNSIISGYARHGRADKALEIFAKMKTERQTPNHVTFVGVLSACSHGGLVREGFEHFKSMSKEFGLDPQMEHFSCIVDLLGRSGQLNKVEDFINRMPIEPNAFIWRTVVGSCCRTNGHNSELGRQAAKMLVQLEPGNAVNYVLLSNMYAAGAKWENMAKARSAMRLAAARKEAGRSWVTMKDGIHMFVAGDKSHPETDAIYGKLRELQKKMRDDGYVPQTSSALYDLDLESKEELLSYHSEKLAIAFVLTRKSASTIRIMKNLRAFSLSVSCGNYLQVLDKYLVFKRQVEVFHWLWMSSIGYGCQGNVQTASGSFPLAMDVKEMFELSSLTNALLAESLISVEWEMIACGKFPWSLQNCFSGNYVKLWMSLYLDNIQQLLGCNGWLGLWFGTSYRKLDFGKYGCVG
ncbi:hypothetical protein Cgig2_011059 [Carnegiea gigantea]|uniref:DYW domain-containing protein n=1 Tax=Carnegiea gigantea TaxID=171969 RepID=A0A9Q1GKJ3_9CARY|nr:hypothetical protein Cgig2_011059 [Carnegiea gigantea]